MLLDHDGIYICGCKFDTTSFLLKYCQKGSLSVHDCVGKEFTHAIPFFLLFIWIVFPLILTASKERHCVNYFIACRKKRFAHIMNSRVIGYSLIHIGTEDWARTCTMCVLSSFVSSIDFSFLNLIHARQSNSWSFSLFHLGASFCCYTFYTFFSYFLFEFFQNFFRWQLIILFN